MHTQSFAGRAVLRGVVFLIGVALAQPAIAQDALALQNFRAQYDAMLSNLEQLLQARGDTVGLEQARRGREAMRTLSDEQLATVYSRTRLPDLSVAVLASRHLISQARQQASPDAQGLTGVLSAGFPGAVDIPAGCNGVDIEASSRYALLIIKEVANSILAAAAWVCNEDILGTNGSLACVPLAIAADIANGFFNTATFCAGEVTANQIDANFRRLDHLHTDLEGAITTVVTTSNANTTTIVNNDNANASAIVNNDNSNTATIVANDNANTVAIVTNDNTNTATILTNANANKNELRDLLLRSQIEADLAMADSAAVVVLYELPTTHGGYLDLVTTIVTESIAHVQAAGGSIRNAQSALAEANAAKAAGMFKTAYALYRRAYKAAVN
jgi:hypothetical protein